MKMRNSGFLIIFIFTVSVYFLLTELTYPYIDPGSGSYVIQLAIAFLLGSLAMLKIYWSKIRSFFQRRTFKDPNDSKR